MGKERNEQTPAVTREGSTLSETPNLLDLASGANRVRSKTNFWRTLDQAHDTDDYRKAVDDEFPHRDSLKDAIDRRDFLKFVGASTLVGGLAAGCRNLPVEKIVPYVTAPEEFVPGKPQYYATSFVHAGSAIGVLAESHMGRPTKFEGNPEHPSSLGSTDAITQAAIYGLYDPDRLQEVSKSKDVGTWESFFVEARKILAENPSSFRILSESAQSPSFEALAAQLVNKYPGLRWHRYEPVGGENALDGAKLAFGTAVRPVYSVGKANVIVTLDADLFAGVPGSVRYAREFSERRKIGDAMNRVYSVESYPTLIGSMADHRLALKPSEVERFARTLAGLVGVAGAASGDFEAAPWISDLAADLNANRGSSLVVAGEHQPAEVHALAHAMNSALGNVGSTVHYVEDRTGESPIESLKALVDDIKSGGVKALLVLGGNPAYSAPGDLEFGSALSGLPFSAHWTLNLNETSALCKWQLPANHFLESWGDARAHDGTISLIQPLIRPLYAGKSAYEVLDALMGGARTNRDIVRGYWLATRFPGEPAATASAQKSQNKAWEAWLEKGFIPNTAAAPVAVSVSGPVPPSSEARATGLETLFLPDPHIFDGRYANVPWLQELPKPFTSMTWDNPVQMSPKTAKAQGLENHDVVELTLNGRSVQGPVWIVPGMADDTFVLNLGYGRKRGGMIAEGPGFDVYAIKPSTMHSYVAGVEVKKVGSNFPLAATHGHHLTKNRDIVRVGTVSELQSNPSLAPEHAFDPKLDEERNLYNPKEHAHDGYQWAMAIDLNHCIGCNACVAACQVENNIPNVGKEQVIRQRELHWMRIDRYYLGNEESPEEIVFQPLTCMHCEQATCEPVCPVAATVHSKEGLNQMVYNRCVGTRYCSNNCPYKVRRFNYINYGDRHDYPSTEDKKKPAPTLRLLQNPDVTVRGRGVMEKCTYCVQRINQARIDAKKRGEPIKDGEIQTACQQACPTKTITFGNMADPNSAVSKKRSDPRNWQLLEELNTKPRTTYLAKVKNPRANA